MDKREWLRSQGFEVGKRGRFSTEMKAALNGQTFTEEYQAWKSEEKAAQEPVPKIPNTPKRTDGVKLYKATLDDGIVIKFDYCPSCKESVIYCHCASPLPPKWLRESIDTWEVVV